MLKSSVSEEVKLKRKWEMGNYEDKFCSDFKITAESKAIPEVWQFIPSEEKRPYGSKISPKSPKFQIVHCKQDF